jgi:hypothetical protein
MQRNSILLFAPILCALSLPCGVESQVDSLRLGIGGLAWHEVGEEVIGLDDAAVAGSLQPYELNPQVNIALGSQTESGQFTNIFGHVWEISGAPPSLCSGYNALGVWVPWSGADYRWRY